MSNLQIELSCPYEVANSEWLEIVDMINHHICRGNYSTVSAHIVSGLKKRAPDGLSPDHNHVFIGGVCRACGEITQTARR